MKLFKKENIKKENEIKSSWRTDSIDFWDRIEGGFFEKFM